ncbi:hypothetical protein [Chitinophaga barathri]|nr:hypothetical protein [Chitinophaga barathri]
METIWNIIIETVLLILFHYPGAAIRWVFLLGRKPFRQLLKDDGYLNGSIGIVVVSFAVWLTTKAL